MINPSINKDFVVSSDMESLTESNSSNERLLPQYRTSKKKVKDPSETPMYKNWKSYAWSLLLMIASSMFQAHLLA